MGLDGGQMERWLLSSLLTAILFVGGCSGNPEDSPLATIIPVLAAFSGNPQMAAEAEANVESTREARAAAAERQEERGARKDAFEEAEAIPGRTVTDDDDDTGANGCYRAFWNQDVLNATQVIYRNICTNRKIAVFYYCSPPYDEMTPVQYGEADALTNAAIECSPGNRPKLAHVAYESFPRNDDFTGWFARVDRTQ
jgi:hypothetical protein